MSYNSYILYTVHSQKVFKYQHLNIEYDSEGLKLANVNPRSIIPLMNSYYLLSVGIELGKSVAQAGPSLTFNPEGCV